MSSVTSLDEAAAVAHFLTIHDPEASPEALQAAMLWIESSPRNAALFDRVANFSSLCDAVPPAAFDDSESARQLRWTGWSSFAKDNLQRAAIWIAALLVPASLLIISFDFLRSNEPVSAALEYARYATGPGEVRSFNLGDGSRVTMGGGSAISVRFSSGVRNLNLERGEAYFQVEKDATRPFRVRSSKGYTEALGTAFNVRKTGKAVAVTLAEGSVRVVATGSNRPQATRLAAGSQVQYFEDGRVSRPRKVIIDDVLPLRTGELHIVGKPLRAVVAELNRYSVKPILLSDKAAGDMVVSGIVRFDDITEWLYGVAEMSGMQVDERNNAFLLRSRPENKHRI